MPAGGRWQDCQNPLGSALTNTLSLLPPHQPRQQDTHPCLLQGDKSLPS